ncbi:MAG: PHB depolymerase family esterase [Minicystis sp.]
MMKRMMGLAAIAALSAACSSGEAPTGASSSSGSGGGTTTMGTGGAGGSMLPPIGGDRPVDVVEPASLAPGEKAPLVILLHGYGVSGLVEDLYMGLTAAAKTRGFFYAHPSGTVDQMGSYFWNATDACCNFYGSTVDDSAYLTSVIDEIIARYPVDPKRVYLIGHSNGGFMSHRMACEHADKIAAIASLAGAMYLDPAKCQPSSPVHVLQIHGTADAEVLFAGETSGSGPMPVGYPGAEETVSDWAAKNGCSATPDKTEPPLDLDAKLDGAETTVERYATGCKAGGSAELWAIQGGSHIPEIADGFRQSVIDYLLAHPKP